jgi:NodT family efflux transporter outer membrane factor (OMF) lipoprotein
MTTTLSPLPTTGISGSSRMIRTPFMDNTNQYRRSVLGYWSRWWTFISWSLVPCFLSGCLVGPDHTHPPAPLTNEWKDPSQETHGCGVGSKYPWWTDFQDPALDSLIERAILANPNLQKAGFRVMEARAQLGAVNGELFPDMDATGNYFFRRASGNGSPFAVQNQESFDFYGVGFDASWEIDLWGKLRRAVESADANVGVAASDYHDVLLTLLGDVAAAYVELRMFQERIAVAHENLRIQENTLQQVSARRGVGLVRPLDVEQAKSNLYATQSTVPTLEIGLQKSENRLCILCGAAPYDLQEELGTQGAIPIAIGEAAIGIPADLLRRRPDIRSAERSVASENARIGVATAELFPQVTILGTLGVDSKDVSVLFTTGSLVHRVGPSFRWNILNYRRIRNGIWAQRARYQQARYQFESQVLLAAEEVENALISYRREQTRMQTLGLAVQAAKESVRLSKMYYEQGLSIFQTVSDTQRSLLVLQDQWTASRASVSLNRIALYKALGGGWRTAANIACSSRARIGYSNPEIIALPDVEEPQSPIQEQEQDILPLPPSPSPEVIEPAS